MKFIVDAQLPKSLSEFLKHRGHDSIHTIELPLRNATEDPELERITVAEQRVLITKDTDFEESFLLQRLPPKLVLVTTGNITNDDLLSLFSRILDIIVTMLGTNSFVEIDKEKITIRY